MKVTLRFDGGLYYRLIRSPSFVYDPNYTKGKSLLCLEKAKRLWHLDDKPKFLDVIISKRPLKEGHWFKLLNMDFVENKDGEKIEITHDAARFLLEHDFYTFWIAVEA